MINGRKKLLAIRESSGMSARTYSYDKMKIDGRALERGIELYEMAIWKFLGNSVITRLQNGKFRNDKEIQKALQPDTPFGKGHWVDLSGLICPYEALDKLLCTIENEEFTSLEEVNSALAILHKNYYNYEWTWAADALSGFYGKNINEFNAADVIEVVKNWKKSVLDMDKFLYEDAKKEFSMSKMIGFGVDGTNGAREEDFAQVRGEFDSNKTVIAIREHMEKKEKLGNKIIELKNEKMTQVEVIN
jgi:hypothetical protein